MTMMGNAILLAGAMPERALGRAMPLLDLAQPPREIVLERVRACRSVEPDACFDTIVYRSSRMRVLEAGA